MNVKIADLMVENVISCQPHHSIEHVENLMKNNSIHAIPVVETDGKVVGIVSTLDLTKDHKKNSPVSKVMSDRVYTIPMYNDIHHAARLMRNQNIHHVVVTHEKKLKGILSSFDLLKLVEDHRFVMKNPPTKSKKVSRKDR